MSASSSLFPSGPAFQQITTRINKSALDLLVHAQVIESGLGQIPLQAHIQDLAYPLHSASPGNGRISTVLTGLSANSVAKTLSLWLGSDYFLCRALVPTRTSCFEIHASPGGTWQFITGGQISSFASLDTLASAIEAYEKSPGRGGASSKDRCQIQIPSPEGCDELRMFIPASLDTLRNQASLTSWLGDQAQILIIAGHSDDKIDVSMVETLQTLISAIGALRHLILANVEGNREIPAWARMLNSPLMLPAVFLQQTSGRAVGAAEPEKLVLLEFARLRQIEGATYLVIDALATEATSTQNRRRLLDPSRQGLTPVAGLDSNPRSVNDKVLRPFQTDMEQVRRGAEEQSARALGAEGKLYQSIVHIVDSMDFEGLRQENLAHSIRLSVGAGTLERIRVMVRKDFSQSLRDDLRQIDDAVEASVEVLQGALGEKTGYAHRIIVSGADVDRLKDALGALVQVNIRYKGEIPRSTWKTRFQGARNWMMGVSMFMMLTAGIGTLTSQETGKELRNYLMVGMLFAFIFGLFAAIFGYKKIRAEAIYREMDKLKDASAQELTRLFQSLAGEKRRIIAEHIQRVSRDVEMEVNRILSQSSESTRVEGERVRASSAEKARILDNKIRMLQQSQLACRQIGTEIGQIQSQLATIVASLPPPVTPAPSTSLPTPATFAAQPLVQVAPTRPAPDTSRPLPSKTPSPLDSYVPPPVVTQNIT